MSANFDGFSEAEGKEFANRWLPDWTGNDPKRLASFYADDAFYSDPAVPEGVQGKAALTSYFQALLGRFPDWEWTNRKVVPLDGGFLNFWHATIGPTVIEADGVCTVQLRDGLIARNEVYFDRSELLTAIAAI